MDEKILILLSTYNGEKYLKEQLDSILAQSYPNIEIIARDDGSNDDTLKILKSYNIKILDTKENFGAKKSFSTLLAYALKNTDSEYFMFCDQDDVWESDKIDKTLKKMQELEKLYPDTPLLVHTDLNVVDENLTLLDNSFWHYQNINPKHDSLNRVLMQNVVTGCTMMINRKLALLSLPMSNEAIIHDWWIALVAAQFGHIGYIEEQTIQYRQHGKNDTGAKKFDLQFVFKRTKEFRNISVDKNIAQAKAFLEQFENEIDEDTKAMLKEFTTLEQKSWLQKRVVLLKYKLLKQGFIRNVGLLLKI